MIDEDFLFFTEHRLPGDVPTGDPESRIGGSIVAFYGELPVMYSAWEADRAEEDTWFVAVGGDSEAISC